MGVVTTDIANITEKDTKELNEVITILMDCTKRYQQSEDLASLENLKREVLGHLQRMASLFAKIKRFKGPNHTYLENAIKRIKAETMEIIMQRGVGITVAEREYASHPYYTERMVVVEKLQAFCIKVEELYHSFEMTLKSIIQSVSIANKELHNIIQNGSSGNFNSNED
jgi:hypothetical protein